MCDDHWYNIDCDDGVAVACQRGIITMPLAGSTRDKRCHGARILFWALYDQSILR